MPMRRTLVGILGLALLLVGLACCRRPDPLPCPAPAPAPRPVPVDDTAAMRAAEEEARRKTAAEDARRKAEVEPKPYIPPQPPPEITPTMPKRLVRKPKVSTSPGPAPIPGHDQIRYSAPSTMALAVPVLCTVDIADAATIGKLPALAGPYQTQNLPRATHYLIGLEAELPDRFKVEPTPGQEQKQHRAPAAQAAHWQYRVTPLKTGTHKLLYTLRVYREGDDAGTVIRVEPVEVVVTMKWPVSHKAEGLRMARDYGVWTALVGLVAALLGAWLKPRSKTTEENGE